MNWFYQLFLINTVALANDSNKLISVIVLFRHGARAPTDKLSNQTYQQYFPNGLGELTSKGIEHSYLLGKFLRDRYVATGFLRTPLLPSQVYFRSKANNRCLMSASLVANGMFDVDGRPSGAVVPIYSQEKGDRLLSGTLGCDVELKRINDTCGRQPAPSYTNFTEYEGFIYECLGLQKNSTLFPTGKSFEVADSFINEYQNGLPMPPWFDEHRKEIYGSFVKVENFIIGAGEYHNPDVLRVKSGFLLYTVLNQLKSNWERFASQGALEKNKFIAYSTKHALEHSHSKSIQGPVEINSSLNEIALIGTEVDRAFGANLISTPKGRRKPSKAKKLGSLEECVTQPSLRASLEGRPRKSTNPVTLFSLDIYAAHRWRFDENPRTTTIISTASLPPSTPRSALEQAT